MPQASLGRERARRRAPRTFGAALHDLTQSGAKQGERVLIVGARAIGLYVAFRARRLGASDVIVTDLHRFQEEQAMSLGATAFIKTDAERAGAVSDRRGVSARHQKRL